MNFDQSIVSAVNGHVEAFREERVTSPYNTIVGMMDPRDMV
jgi:hypothetical protein